ncbi:MAG: hypothetical protein AAF823_10735 [Planctomycetota bacterium]
MPMGDDESSVAPDESNKSMSLMGGVGGGDDALDGVIVDETPSAGRSPWVQTFILLALVAALGGGAIYVMRAAQDSVQTRGTDGLASRIDDALGRLTNASVMRDDDPYSPRAVNELFSDTDRVLAIFATDPTEKQVPVGLLKKNPFSLRVQRVVTETGEAAPEIDLAEQKRQAELRQAYRRLKLQSVIDMRVPVAVINGDMYRVGQQIEGFEIAAISSRNQAVKLTAGGRDWVLRMETQGR